MDILQWLRDFTRGGVSDTMPPSLGRQPHGALTRGRVAASGSVGMSPMGPLSGRADAHPVLVVGVGMPCSTQMSPYLPGRGGRPC